jgi:predicted ester cyclase
MRQGPSVKSGSSNVVPQHTGTASIAHGRKRGPFTQLLVGLAVLIGLAGTPGLVSANPLLVENNETGGNGGVSTALDNRNVALRLFDEVFSQRKVDVCKTLMTVGAVNHTSAGEFVGPAGFELFVADVWEAFPDAAFTIDAAHTEGDVLTMRWTMNGSHQGTFMDRAATGNPVHLQGIAIFRFEHGMIAESWIQYDRLSLLDQVTQPADVPGICPPCEEP